MKLRTIIRFFDKLEDKTRYHLSHYPILYAFIGGIGIVLFWKGVWEMAEALPILHGIGSVIVGVIILLASGLLVSFFIGDSIILSGFKREKKLVEKTEDEVQAETNKVETAVLEIAAMRKQLNRIARDVKTHHTEEEHSH